jgi:glycosyltransferase involved in cell wall biosynthesis
MCKLEKKKSLLIVHPSNDFTGSTKVLSNVIKQNFLNCNVTVLTIDKREGFLSNIDCVTVKKISFPTFKGKSIFLLSSVLSFFDRIIKVFILAAHSDLVYINTVKPYYAAWIARLQNKPIVWHVHEIFSNKTIPVRIMEYTLCHTNAKFIFVSKYIAQQYVLSPNSFSEVVYNKLDKDFIQNSKVREIDRRDRKNILMPASLTKAKGIYNYICLAKIMPHLNFKLVLSAQTDEVKVFIDEIDIPSNCIVLAQQKNMNQHYETADLLLNLSIPYLCVETFGMTIIEGFAYGIPAIAPNVGGPVELIKNGYNGMLVDDVTDLNKLQEAINYILDIHNYGKYAENALESSSLYK